MENLLLIFYLDFVVNLLWILEYFWNLILLNFYIYWAVLNFSFSYWFTEMYLIFVISSSLLELFILFILFILLISYSFTVKDFTELFLLFIFISFLLSFFSFGCCSIFSKDLFDWGISILLFGFISSFWFGSWREMFFLFCGLPFYLLLNTKLKKFYFIFYINF